MKKYISCILLAAITLFTFCACSEREQDNTDDSDNAVVRSNIAFYVYDGEGIQIAYVDDYTENSVTLSVNVRYIIKTDLDTSHGIGFTNAAISFDYDDEYISIEEYDLEGVTSHKFYFTGLQTTENTVLTVSISAANSPKEINIMLTE